MKIRSLVNIPVSACVALVVFGAAGIAHTMGLLSKAAGASERSLAARDSRAATAVCAVPAVEKEPALFVSCGGFLP